MKNPQNIHQRCSNWQPMALMAALVTLIAVPLRAAESVETAVPPGGSSLLAALARVAGDWVNAVAAGGGTWGHLLMGGLCLLLVAVGVQVLRWVLRRAAKRNETMGTGPEAEAIPWAKLVIEAVIPPLTLFVWAWGVYAAFTFVFAQMAQPSMVLSGGVRWLKNTGEIGAAFWFVFRLIRVVEVRLKFWTARTENKWDDVLAAVVVRALRLVVPLVAVILLVPTLDLPAASNQFFKQAAGLLLIGAVGFILFQLVQAVEEAVLRQFRIDVKDNLEARKVYTQVKVLKKIAVVLIVIFTAASMLMVFDSVRQLGTSILASAGVLGIIIGFAAQRSIATVLAGFQIAMTQPIRLDDVVIVEGEWGRIEEITLTYVVVRIWDQRRLVLPINYFIEKPFQNWTRVSAELLGTVYLHTDYTVPLGPLREELDRVLAGTNLWDGRVKLIQVTDAKERTLELRVLVSAADAPTAWDLRCLVREKLVDFLQRHQPGCLPRLRAELWGEARPSSKAIA
jgi:small-conductance mechanosensitive channel